MTIIQPDHDAPDGMPRAGPQQAFIFEMLARDSGAGATIREIMEVTGGKPNTVHAALSTLRFNGRRFTVEPAGEEWRFRITPD